MFENLSFILLGIFVLITIKSGQHSEVLPYFENDQLLTAARASP